MATSVEFALDKLTIRAKSHDSLLTPLRDDPSASAAPIAGLDTEVGATLNRVGVATNRVGVATKRVGVATLGCKVNTFESELIAEALQTDAWTVVPQSEMADLYVINTCTVTREADRQARQVVRKLVKQNPEALVVVTGCYAQIDPSACAAIPGVDLVLGNDRKLDVHTLLPALKRGDLPKVLVGDLDQHISLPNALLTHYEAQTRAFVQIQQGCDQGCTFCIIHVARGPSRSLPLTLIKRQVQKLVLSGYAEIVICGVDLGSYGEDFGRAESAINLVALLEELLLLEHEPGNPFRIRLSSLDPAHIRDELITLMANNPRLVPHLHLSLQSGNDLILKRMKRRYGAQLVRERILRLRGVVPQLVMSADVMVGFPTETEAQFEDTWRLLEELDIAYPHVFSYSERDGTPAARIPAAKQVAVADRKERNKLLRERALALQARVLQSRVGQQAWVLPENRLLDGGVRLARAEDYLPVLLNQNQAELGRWMRVEYTGIQDGHLVGVPL